MLTPSAFIHNRNPTEKIAKVEQIEEAIHFDLKCRTFAEFYMFTDRNDTSNIEITTKLF